MLHIKIEKRNNLFFIKESDVFNLDFWTYVCDGVNEYGMPKPKEFKNEDEVYKWIEKK